MLARLFSRPTIEERVGFHQFAGWYGAPMDFGYTPSAVTIRSTLGHAASSACIDVLATSVSTLPVDAVRMSGDIRRPVTPTPQLAVQPSALVEIDSWLYQLVDSMLTDGNAFGLVVAVDQAQRPTQIELVDPDCVQEREVVKGVPQARVDNTLHKVYPYGDLWHVPGKFVRAGSPFADSPIERAAATIGTAIAAREFGSKFFADGGYPSGIIYSDRELDATQAEGIKQRFVEAMRGSRRPAVLGAGLKYEGVTVTPEETQFLELLRFCIEEACRFWRVPPSMVYAAVSGQNVTYANVTQADLHYLKHSLEGLLVRIENAMSRLLARPQRVRFNRNAFLRSDAAGRNEIYDARLKNRSMSVNEVRALEDEPPFSEEFDEPGIPGVTPPQENDNAGSTD